MDRDEVLKLPKAGPEGVAEWNRRREADEAIPDVPGAANRGWSDIDRLGAASGCGMPVPRSAGIAPGGMVLHVLNRGVARMQLFEKPADDQAFEQVLRETLDEPPMRICACALEAVPVVVGM
jgi:hypothetical protein